MGRIANICGDIDATYIERTGLLKQLTGEDLITAEHKFRKPAQFTCWAVPVFSCQRDPHLIGHLPRLAAALGGVQLPQHLPAHPRRWKPRCASRASWKGSPWQAWRRLRELMGRTPPEFTRTAAGDAAKAEFVARQDPLHGWMTECCWVLDGQRCWTDRRNAYSSYRDWCDDSGVRYPLGKLKLYALCKERFGETVHRGWPGYPGLWLMNSYSEGQGPPAGG